MNQDSARIFNKIYEINSQFLTINRALAKEYAAIISPLNALLNDMRIVYMRSFFIARFISDLPRLLQPALEYLFDKEVETNFERNLSFRLRLTSSVRTLRTMRSSFLDEARRLSMFAEKGVEAAAFPSTGFSTPQLPLLEVMARTDNYIERASDVGYGSYTKASTEIAVVLKHQGVYARPAETSRRVRRGKQTEAPSSSEETSELTYDYQVPRREKKGAPLSDEETSEAYAYESLSLTKMLLKASETIGALTGKLTEPRWDTTQRYGQGHPLAQSISEAYGSRALQPASRFDEVYHSIERGPLLSFYQTVVQRLSEYESGVFQQTSRSYEAYGLTEMMRTAIIPLSVAEEVSEVFMSELWFPPRRTVSETKEDRTRTGLIFRIIELGLPSIADGEIRTYEGQPPLMEATIEKAPGIGYSISRLMAEMVTGVKAAAHEFGQLVAAHSDVPQQIGKSFFDSFRAVNKYLSEVSGTQSLYEPLQVFSKVSSDYIERSSEIMLQMRSAGGLEAEWGLHVASSIMEAIGTVATVPRISEHAFLATLSEISGLESTTAGGLVNVIPEFERVISEEAMVASSPLLLKTVFPIRAGFDIFEAEEPYQTEVARAVEYLRKGRGLGLEVEGETRSYDLYSTSFLEMAATMMSYADAISNVGRSDKGVSSLPRGLMTYGAAMGEYAKRNVGLIAGLLNTPEELFTLERVPLETSRTFPNIKLHEIVPLMTSVRAAVAAIDRSRVIERAKPAEISRSIEINIEPPEDGYDLRDLRTKIARILREEARRHGVF